MNQYDPKHIDKALKRMEKSDTLKGIHRPDTNIMSFFNDIEEDNQLEKQKSAAELKKEQYLKKVNSLKKLVENISKEEFKKLYNESKLSWKTSNYMSLEFLSRLEDNESKANEVLNDVMRYASSSTKVSSQFIKIS